MSALDWTIVILSVAGLMGVSIIIGRRQKNQDDYYLGGRRIPWWLAGSSLMANQASTVSLIGAPAFIAAREGGGLAWLQYELAVPLAMAFIAALLLPAYRRAGGYTIYAYLERRFGPAVRRSVSALFLLNRCLGSGVILLATSYVTSLLLKIDVPQTILLVGAAALAYTTIGGLTVDIYTDLVQLVILWASAIACAITILHYMDFSVTFPAGEAARLSVYRFTATGIGDGQTFAVWPMLFGGFFLYLSYYGCDQSQVQRLLATADGRSSRAALVLNGIARFPLVISYCAIGVLMISFIYHNPVFAERLRGLPPDYLMPLFFTEYLPRGLLGFVVTGMVMASMSSLDSALNSLSAVTWEDFMAPLLPRLAGLPDRKRVLLSRIITMAWGTAAIGFALASAGRSETVIELINKTGSAFYGPVAGTFLAGLFVRGARPRGVLAGLAAGVVTNLALWIFFERSVSWMWWNVTGTAMTLMVAAASSIGRRGGAGGEAPALSRDAAPSVVWLAVWFAVVCISCIAIQAFFSLR